MPPSPHAPPSAYAAPLSRRLDLLAAGASVPEQLPCYVRAAGGSEALPCPGEESFVFYLSGESAVLVAYPPFIPAADILETDVPENDPEGDSPREFPENTEDFRARLEHALTALPTKTRELTLLSPCPVEILPLPSGLQATPEGEFSPIAKDWYWTLPLPCVPPSDKVRNMLHRATREVDIREEAWGPEAASLAASYCRTRKLEEGTSFIYSRIGDYLAACPEARLFTARSRASGFLAACAVGDYTALGMAFYMFAFRRPDAPPGCADALLAALLKEGAQRGHSVMNLGLGIRPGIEFFKKKWRARRGLPYYERTWSIAPVRPARHGLLARLLGA